MQAAAPQLQDIGDETEATRRWYGLDNPTTRNFGRQCHHHVIVVVDRRIQLRVRRLDDAAKAPPEVELPAQIEGRLGSFEIAIRKPRTRFVVADLDRGSTGVDLLALGVFAANGNA